MHINCFKDFRSKTPVESTFKAVVEKIRSDSRPATITAQYRQSGSKQIKELSPLNYAGIYSQVYALYLSGFRYYFTQ